MNNSLRYLLFSFLLFVSAACNKTLQPVKLNMTYYNITDTLAVDTGIINYISPYKDSLGKEMNEVIATSAMQMTKGKPESLLGNLVADLVLKKSRDYFDDNVHISILNYGGLRIPDLPAGNITKGKVFELIPFDNFLVLMFLKGSVIKQLANIIAADGGWPISGMTFVIQDSIANNIFVKGEPLDTSRIYNVAISDYLADGGDNLFFLKEEKRENSGVFLRDVIIKYFEEINAKGDSLYSILDHRITIHE